MLKESSYDMIWKIEEETMKLFAEVIGQNALIEQWRIAEKEIELSPSGFFVGYKVNKDVEKIIYDCRVFHGVDGWINSEEFIIDFILFFNDGKISCLECCFILNSEEYPTEIEKFRVYKSDDRGNEIK